MKSSKIEPIKEIETDNFKTKRKLRRRSNIHIQTHKRKKSPDNQVRNNIKITSNELINKTFKTNSFSESFRQLLDDWNDLLHYRSLSRDAKFLCRMALNIKQIHFDIARTKYPEEMKEQVEGISHFFSTPLGAPCVTTKTLLEAADTLSEQEPKYSDLADLLDYMSYFKVRLAAMIETASTT